MMHALVHSLKRIARAGVVCAVALLWVAVSTVAAQTASAAGTTGGKPAASAAPKQTPPSSSAGAKATTAKPKPAAAAKSSGSSYSAATSAARRARLERARAAARARELALTQPRFKLDDQGSMVPDVRAEAAIIYNPATGQVLWEEKAFDQRSIASITKVMTAICFLEGSPDLSREVMIDRADVRGASTTHLRAFERVSFRNLLHLMLIASDNAAARTLARESPDGAKAFIARMNEKAVELGLTSTRYADPSGLLSDNVSSAYDMARLITYAADDVLLSSIMRTSEYAFRTSRRPLKIHSTNQLLNSPEIDVRGGKTGFISRSGYCLATLLWLPQMNQTVAVVVLGAKSNASRFWETRHLLNWITSRAQSVIGRDASPPSELPIPPGPDRQSHQDRR